MSITRIPNERLYYMGGESMVESMSLDDKKYSLKFDSLAQSKERANSQFRKESQPEPRSESKVKLLEGEPKALGAPIFDRIRERYKNQNRREESNPDVLYDFWIFHRKQSTPEQREKQIQKLKEKMSNAQNVQEKTQRRFLSKMEFDRYLSYEPRDIYYTLVVESTKFKRDQELKKQVEAINNRPRPQSAKKVTDEHIIDRLYHPKGSHKNLSPNTKENKKEDPQAKFARNLIDLYEERVMDVNPMTIDSLYSFWLGVPDKEKQGLVIASADVKPSIEKYMVSQTQNLMRAHHKKKGFECTEGATLIKYYNQATKEVLDRFNVRIPHKSLSVFIKEFNKFREENLKKQAEKAKKEQERVEQERRQLAKTALNRPASATPIEILSQPKATLTEEALELIKQYPNDKALKLVLKTHIHPPARRPQEYGVYQREEEIKIKGWVKDPNLKGVNPEKIIEMLVLDKTIKSLGATAGPAQSSAIVKKILNEEYLEEEEKWTEKHALLKKELKILAYKESWCRLGLLSFAEQQMSKKPADLDNMDDNALIDSIIDYLNKLAENSRKAKLAYLNHDLNMQEARDRFESQKKNITNKEEEEKKLRTNFYRFLHANVRKYFKTFLSDAPLQEDRLRFMKNLFSEAKTLHPVYVEKYYPMVESEVHFGCPPNFKNEFFKLVKEFNKYTGKRDKKLPKSYIWAPTGTNCDQGINQSTFNRVVKEYSRNKSVLQETKQDESHSPQKGGKPGAKTQTVWDKDKLDDRLKFLMTYNEAKECTFKPIVHKATF